MNTIADRLIFLMENLDMKQTELADRVGISKQSLYKYLHCQCEPRAEIIARMANVLNTSADFIVGLTSNHKPIIYNTDKEDIILKEMRLLIKFRKLSPIDKIRIEERIDFLLEKLEYEQD